MLVARVCCRFLVRFGMDADSEDAAFSPSDVGDAVPADAVEGRALSGPQSGWWFAGKDELEGSVEDVDHAFVLVLVVDLDAAAGSKGA